MILNPHFCNTLIDPMLSVAALAKVGQGHRRNVKCLDATPLSPTTSGLAWKIPGRVGDSPILGAGLYVDGEIGAAGSTGRGEANLYGLCSFLIVENLRRGMTPKDAGMEACKRIKANTIEKRLLNSRGEPNFNVNFYVLNAKGEYAGVALYPESSFAVCTEDGPKTLASEPLLSGKPTD